MPAGVLARFWAYKMEPSDDRTKLAVLEERLSALVTFLAERDRRLEERFVAQKAAILRAELSLDAYKAASNEWRGALADSGNKMLVRVEWEAAQKALVDRMDVGSRIADSRLSEIDSRLSKAHNELDKRVVVIEGRAGYASITLLLSVAALLIAFGGIFWGSIHPITIGLPH